MRLSQMTEMVTIVERGSLRAAARHLGQAQPALTRSVRALEKELGVTLFERDARGMALTAMGKLFHQRASAVVNEVRRAQEEMQQAQGNLRGSVVAGLSIMPHVGMLPHALPLFRKKYPGVQLRIIEGLYPSIESGLRDGSIDFYLGASPQATPAPGLVSETLFENTRKVVGRKGHPLLGARSLRELAQAEWATTSISYNAAEDLQALFERHRLPPPQIALQANSALTVMVALASTNLLSILPVQWNEFPLTKGVLQTIDVREKLSAPSIVLIRRPDLPLTPAAEHLCDLLRRGPGK